MPNNPVIEPIIRETTTSAKAGIFRSGPELNGLISIDEPATNRTSEKPVKMKRSLSWLAISEVEMLVVKPSAQIIIASLTNTSLLLNFGTKPDAAASNTTASAAVVAWLAEKSKP